MPSPLRIPWISRGWTPANASLKFITYSMKNKENLEKLDELQIWFQIHILPEKTWEVPVLLCGC